MKVLLLLSVLAVGSLSGQAPDGSLDQLVGVWATSREAPTGREAQVAIIHFYPNGEFMSTLRILSAPDSIGGPSNLSVYPVTAGRWAGMMNSFGHPMLCVQRESDDGRSTCQPAWVDPEARVLYWGPLLFVPIGTARLEALDAEELE
jgi:hypothetical protein